MVLFTCVSSLSFARIQFKRDLAHSDSIDVDQKKTFIILASEIIHLNKDPLTNINTAIDFTQKQFEDLIKFKMTYPFGRDTWKDGLKRVKFVRDEFEENLMVFEKAFKYQSKNAKYHALKMLEKKYLNSIDSIRYDFFLYPILDMVDTK